MKINKPKLDFKGNLTTRSRTDSIIIHHAEWKEASIFDIHNSHKNRGWLGVGYNYYIRKDGSIHQGRPENMIGSHAQGWNSRSIGICLEGSFMTDHPTAQQLESLSWLISDIENRRGKLNILRHKDVNATSCPGDNFSLSSIKKINNKSLHITNIKNGSKGDLVKLLQYALELEADGSFGPLTYTAVIKFQRENGLAIDGVVGTNTWKAILK